MAHVMLSAGLMKDSGLLGWLRAWGVTVAEFAPGDPVAAPTVWDCDVLVADRQTAVDLSGSWKGDPDPVGAPVLVLGQGDFGVPVRAVVADPGPEGGVLLGALQACLAQAAGIRGQIGCAAVMETDPLRILGHELRTPLTAIKTALEVLAADLGGLDPSRNEGDPRHRMVELAMRNVQRLQGAIDWGQTLLVQASGSGSGARLRPVALGELSDHLAACAPVFCEDEDRDLQLVTDPDLLGCLVGQMVQTFKTALPGAPVSIHLDRRGSEPGSLTLSISPTDGATPRSRAVAAGPGAGNPVLKELSRIQLSAESLSALNAEYRLQGSAAGHPVLVLGIAGIESPLPA